jgi:hypothetical protein
LKFALALCLAACASSSSPEPMSMPGAETGEAPAIAAGDQYALATEMIEARALEGLDRVRATTAIERGWNGRRVRWEMMRIDALGTADGYLFAPFDHARFADPVDLAFLPEVTFDAAERARLDELCRAHAPECVVELEATIDPLVYGASETRLALTGGHAVGARARRDGEHFMSRPIPAIGNDSFRNTFVRAVQQ